MNTVNGSVEVAFAGPLRPAELETVNGSVTVTCARDSSFRYDLQTVNGRIRSEFAELSVEGKWGPKEARGDVQRRARGGCRSRRSTARSGSSRRRSPTPAESLQPHSPVVDSGLHRKESAMPNESAPPPSVPASARRPPPPAAGRARRQAPGCWSSRYLGLLALIPLIVEKNDRDVQWHAKHGLVLLGVFFIGWVGDLHASAT